MTQTKQLLLQMHHFRSLQLKEAVLGTTAQIIFSLSARLSERRGSTADFPLVTWWVNTHLGVPQSPSCLCGLLRIYPNYAASWGEINNLTVDPNSSF